MFDLGGFDLGGNKNDLWVIKSGNQIFGITDDKDNLSEIKEYLIYAVGYCEEEIEIEKFKLNMITG